VSACRRFDQSERGGLDGAGQRVKRADVVEAADEPDSSISIAMRFLDGAAQALELVGLAEQASSIALLLEGLVRAHYSNTTP
jgi:hypothetical protein